MSTPDYYEALRVPRTATRDEIISAFRALANMHHPDKGGDPEAFREIQKAYDTLQDPGLRLDYDTMGGVAPDSMEAMVIRQFRELMKRVVAEWQPEHGDIFGLAGTIMGANVKNNVAKIDGLRAELSRLEMMKARIATTDVVNHMATVLDEKIEETQKQEAEFIGACKMIGMILLVMEKYAWVEPGQPE